jgi:hypothetical protein
MKKQEKLDDESIMVLGSLVVGIASSSIVIYLLSQFVKDARQKKSKSKEE